MNAVTTTSLLGARPHPGPFHEPERRSPDRLNSYFNCNEPIGRSALRSFRGTNREPRRLVESLPRGEEESSAVSFADLRLRSSEGRLNGGKGPIAVPSPGGEGQGEGGILPFQSVPPYVGGCQLR